MNFASLYIVLCKYENVIFSFLEGGSNPRSVNSRSVRRSKENLVRVLAILYSENKINYITSL